MRKAAFPIVRPDRRKGFGGQMFEAGRRLGWSTIAATGAGDQSGSGFFAAAGLIRHRHVPYLTDPSAEMIVMRLRDRATGQALGPAMTVDFSKEYSTLPPGGSGREQELQAAAGCGHENRRSDQDQQDKL